MKTRRPRCNECGRPAKSYVEEHTSYTNIVFDLSRRDATSDGFALITAVSNNRKCAVGTMYGKARLVTPISGLPLRESASPKVRITTDFPGGHPII